MSPIFSPYTYRNGIIAPYLLTFPDVGMGDAGVGWWWIKDCLLRPTAFHGLCHGIIAFQNHALCAIFTVFLLILALGITIFSKFTTHGHFLENLASDLFNIVNNVPDFPLRAFRFSVNVHAKIHLLFVRHSLAMLLHYAKVVPLQHRVT